MGIDTINDKSSRNAIHFAVGSLRNEAGKGRFAAKISLISRQLAALQAPRSPPYSRPMTLAAIDWLSISINLLLVIFVIVCLLMTLLILMQRPKQEGLGAAFGGGVTDQVFGARTTNVLQRGTVYLGSLFFVLSLTLAVLIGQKNQKTSMVVPKVESKDAAKEQPAPAVQEPPVAPAPVSEAPAAPVPANAAPESLEKSGQP